MTDERAVWQDLLQSDGWKLLTQYIGSQYGAGALLNAANHEMQTAGHDAAAYGLVMRIMLAKAEVAADLVKYPALRLRAIDGQAEQVAHAASQHPKSRRRS